MHERLGPGVVLRRPALDEVARQRERSAREADQRRAVRVRPPATSDGVADVGHVRRVRAGAARPGRPRARTGCSTTGPTPATMSTPTPTATSGTTMSENRIAASTPCRRTGCSVISVTSVGVAAGVEHGVVGAQRAVLRQRAPGLAHEPHRRAVAGVPDAARTSSDSAGRLGVVAVLSRAGDRAPSGADAASLAARRRSSAPSSHAALGAPDPRRRTRVRVWPCTSRQGTRTTTGSGEMTSELYLYCPVCGTDRPAELPSADGSADAHDDEALCSDCGIGAVPRSARRGGRERRVTTSASSVASMTAPTRRTTRTVPRSSAQRSPA